MPWLRTLEAGVQLCLCLQLWDLGGYGGPLRSFGALAVRLCSHLPWLLSLLTCHLAGTHGGGEAWSPFLGLVKMSAVLIAGFAGQLLAVGSFPPVYLSATLYDSAWGWGFLGRGGRLHLITRNGPEPPLLPRGGLSGSNQRAAAPGEVSESLRSSGLGLAGGDDINK